MTGEPRTRGGQLQEQLLGTVTLGQALQVAPGLRGAAALLRREGRAQGGLSREGNPQQQPESSSQHWESQSAGAGAGQGARASWGHRWHRSPVPRWALKGLKGAGSTGCPLPEPGLGVPSSSALLGLGLSLPPPPCHPPVTWTLFQVEKYPLVADAAS